MAKYNKVDHPRQQVNICREISQSKILHPDNGIKSPVINPDMTAYDIGYAYGEAGFAFEDTPENFKNNPSFKNGYEVYRRLLKIAEMERTSGINYYNSGKRLEDMEEKYRVKKTDNFIDGYNYAARRDGIAFYNNGEILELLSDEERAKLNEHFVLGYEEARFNSSIKIDESSKRR